MNWGSTGNAVYDKSSWDLDVKCSPFPNPSVLKKKKKLDNGKYTGIPETGTSYTNVNDEEFLKIYLLADNFFCLLRIELGASHMPSPIYPLEHGDSRV